VSENMFRWGRFNLILFDPTDRPNPGTTGDGTCIDVLVVARSSVLPKTRNPIKKGETLAGRQSLAHQVSVARTFVLQQGQAYYNQGRADNDRLPIRLTFIVMWGTVLQPGIPTNISEFLATAKQGKNVLIVFLFFLFLFSHTIFFSH
jgi:hypothetical protein